MGSGSDGETPTKKHWISDPSQQGSFLGHCDCIQSRGQGSKFGPSFFMANHFSFWRMIQTQGMTPTTTATSTTATTRTIENIFLGAVIVAGHVNLRDAESPCCRHLSAEIRIWMTLVVRASALQQLLHIISLVPVAVYRFLHWWSRRNQEQYLLLLTC